MHSARPLPDWRPCPACGRRLDALRAREVLLLPDGFRHLCDLDCRRAYVAGERASQAHLTPDEVPSPLRPRATERPSSIPPEAPSDVEARSAQLPARRAAACVLAFLVALIPAAPFSSIVAALIVFGVNTANVVESHGLRKRLGITGWLMGPVGVTLMVLGGLLGEVSNQEGGASMLAAALGVGVLTLRGWLDDQSQGLLFHALAELRDALPDHARIPVHHAMRPLEVDSLRVRASKVKTGEEVLLAEGEVAAVDGVVQSGEAWVIPHPGTRIPIRKSTGDPVLAGTHVIEGTLQVMASRVGADRALLRPHAIGTGACPESAHGLLIAQRAVKAVPALAGVLAFGCLLWLIGGAPGVGLAVAGAVLTAAPLLSLVRSVSDPLMAGAASATTRGVIFQSGRTLELGGRVGVAALCSHGVVTVGAPDLNAILPVAPEDPLPLLALAASAERAAEHHPIGRAILSHAERLGAPVVSVRRAVHIAGQGVTAVTPAGESFVLGNRQLLLKEGVSIALADEVAEAQEQRGCTVLFLGIGGHTRAVLSLHDPIRLGARAAVQRMYDLQIEPALVSGDHRATVEALAHHLEIAHVKAELLPEERGAEIERLAPAEATVAAIGYSPADDDALGASGVPIVLGAAGSGTSDRGVSLASHDLRDAAGALWVARETRRSMDRNLRLGVLGGAAIALLCASSVIAPALAVLACGAIDAYVLRTGMRLLRRVDLRVPRRT